MTAALALHLSGIAAALAAYLECVRWRIMRPGYPLFDPWDEDLVRLGGNLAAIVSMSLYLFSEF